MDDDDNDDNAYQRGQTITILKLRLILPIIRAYNCKGDILQPEEDILRQKNDDLPVKFQKDWDKIVGGVALTRYLMSISFCSNLAQK